MIEKKLRIGEKIGLGFGLVGLLFLGVIWQYHTTLNRSLADYQYLNDIYGAKKDHLLAIDVGLLNARQSEKNFLLKRDPIFSQEVSHQVQNTLDVSDKFYTLDLSASEASTQFKKYLLSYQQHFMLVEAAWIKKGLDENSGLQGSFRNAVHALEKMAAQLKTDSLYLNLLQIRRAEKDMGLRQEEQYKALTLDLIDEFKNKTQKSSLNTELKKNLVHEIEVYKKTFINYSETALAHQDIQGGKGLFRESAHRLEETIKQHYVPDLDRNILQLRRHEKDYLLRGDDKYVELVFQMIQKIQNQTEHSQINSQTKSLFIKLLSNYHHDFLALVEQNKYIIEKVDDMEKAASNINQLVKNNVVISNQAMVDMTHKINSTSSEQVTIMLWIVLIAILLGFYFAVSITRNIANPLVQMAAILENLTVTELIQPMPFQKNGRDEVNAMAGSLNILADNRKHFIDWWKNSMSETESSTQLENILQQLSHQSEQDEDSKSELKQIKIELAEILEEKKILLSGEFQEIRKLNEEILKQAALLNHSSIAQEVVFEVSHAISYSSELMKNNLDMLSHRI